MVSGGVPSTHPGSPRAHRRCSRRADGCRGEVGGERSELGERCLAEDAHQRSGREGLRTMELRQTLLQLLVFKLRLVSAVSA
jgi:hypothetical protein